MVWLARAVRAPDAWDRFDQHTSDSDFPVDVIVDLIGKDAADVSLWEVHDLDGADMQRLVAAISVTSQAKVLQTLHFRFVTFDAVKNLGISLKQSRGNTIDKLFLRNRHWSLEAASCSKAVNLAKALNEINPKTFSKDRVMDFVCNSILADYMPLHEVPADLVREIHKARRLVTR